jgi:hypothetical protein
MFHDKAKLCCYVFDLGIPDEHFPTPPDCWKLENERS